MNAKGVDDRAREARRPIGTLGTVARATVGALLVGDVVLGQLRGDFDPTPFFVGLIVFPAVVLAWQCWRARHNPARLVATGPAGHAMTVVVFLALYLTWWYAPAVSALSDAALLFYGTSMSPLPSGATPAARCWRSPTGSFSATIRLGAFSSSPSTVANGRGVGMAPPPSSLSALRRGMQELHVHHG